MNLANRFLQRPDYVVEGQDGELTVTRTSLFTQRRNTMTLPITRAQLNEYVVGGSLIQDVFPTLSPDEREFIQSGATSSEWDDIFKSDPDEEDL